VKLTPPDIADEASAVKQHLLPKKSGDLYNTENVDHKVEDLYFFAFCENKASKTFSLYRVGHRIRAREKSRLLIW
jgi:hypothetical protein